VALALIEKLYVNFLKAPLKQVNKKTNVINFESNYLALSTVIQQ